jgi:hypothetical protein
MEGPAKQQVKKEHLLYYFSHRNITVDQTTRRGKQWVCIELGSAVANEQLITINSRLSKRYADSRMIDFGYNSLEGSPNRVTLVDPRRQYSGSLLGDFFAGIPGP